MPVWEAWRAVHNGGRGEGGRFDLGALLAWARLHRMGPEEVAAVLNLEEHYRKRKGSG